jgi:hypothetical protein
MHTNAAAFIRLINRERPTTPCRPTVPRWSGFKAYHNQQHARRSIISRIIDSPIIMVGLITQPCAPVVVGTVCKAHFFSIFLRGPGSQEFSAARPRRFHSSCTIYAWRNRLRLSREKNASWKQLADDRSIAKQSLCCSGVVTRRLKAK